MKYGHTVSIFILIIILTVCCTPKLKNQLFEYRIIETNLAVITIPKEYELERKTDFSLDLNINDTIIKVCMSKFDSIGTVCDIKLLALKGVRSNIGKEKAMKRSEITVGRKYENKFYEINSVNKLDPDSTRYYSFKLCSKKDRGKIIILGKDLNIIRRKEMKWIADNIKWTED